MIVGIDEAGRGCWAGPLVAAAVLLKKPISGLNDSKVLSKKSRLNFYDKINDSALVGIGIVSSQVVDKAGLTKATSIAMAEALVSITATDIEVIIDGNYNYLPDILGVKTLVSADASVPEVSAASIIAKVTRDIIMEQEAVNYPKFSFDRHVGYGTKLHLSELLEYGPTAIHRLSYKPVKNAIQG